MSIRAISGLVILAVIVLVGGYDVYAFINGGTEGTISHVVMSWSYDFPVFTFMFGFLSGHFFWRIRDVRKELPKESESVPGDAA